MRLVSPVFFRVVPKTGGTSRKRQFNVSLLFWLLRIKHLRAFSIFSKWMRIYIICINTYRYTHIDALTHILRCLHMHGDTYIYVHIHERFAKEIEIHLNLA